MKSAIQPLKFYSMIGLVMNIDGYWVFDSWHVISNCHMLPPDSYLVLNWLDIWWELLYGVYQKTTEMIVNRCYWMVMVCICRYLQFNWMIVGILLYFMCIFLCAIMMIHWTAISILLQNNWYWSEVLTEILCLLYLWSLHRWLLWW